MSGLALGELGIVSGPSNTKDGRKYNLLIKKASGKDVFVKNGNVLETVESCIDLVAEHYLEVEELAKMQQVDSLKSTCRNVFVLFRTIGEVVGALIRGKVVREN
jgi:hypothetical protein